jgi:hypothetical protein
MHMRRISGEQYASRPIAAGYSVVDAESGTPDQLLDPARPFAGPALVEQSLHI